MSLGGSLSGISFSGLSSGIDTDSIISKLLQLEAQPVGRWQRQQAELQSRKGLLDQFKARVTAVSSSLGLLNSASAFNPITAATSTATTATVTASGDAAAGIFNLAVSKLAQTHKISSTAQTDTTSALGLSGNLVVNGKGIKVETTDSLKSIATKINSASAGVTASLIDGGAGSAYLTLTAKDSGAAAKIQIGDLDGTVASSLGLANGATSVRETVTGGGASASFSSSSTAVGTMLGMTGLGSQTFSLNGTDVTVNLDTASLQDIAAAINSSGSGATASVRSVTSNGTTSYKLDILGATTTTDADGVLQGLGYLQKGFGSQLVAAQDAAFTVDGVSLTSASNTVSTVIPGATITLLDANETTPKTTTISLTRDDSAVKKKIHDFADAYNSLVDFVKTNSSLDTDTFATGGLFGDPIVQQIEGSLAGLMFSTVNSGGAFSNLTQIGFAFDKDSKLTIDDSKLSSAVSSDANSVSSLFRAMGTSTNTQLSYVASGSKAKASGPAGYSVVITAAAAQHKLEAGTAQTGALTAQETLTFNGTLFGDTPYSLVLESGLTQSQVVDKINSDAKLKDMMTATVVGGKLTLTAKKYGTASTFTVSSNQSGATSSGLDGNVIAAAGANVAGTINGEAATGTGQVLAGDVGNANTEGLQLLYTGTAIGAVGTMVYSKGISSMASDLVSTFTDSVNGLITASGKSIDDQISLLQENIDGMNERLLTMQTDLKTKFAGMETALASLQSQQAQIAQAFAKM